MSCGTVMDCHTGIRSRFGSKVSCGNSTAVDSGVVP